VVSGYTPRTFAVSASSSYRPVCRESGVAKYLERRRGYRFEQLFIHRHPDITYTLALFLRADR